MIITQSDINFYNEHKNEYTHILSIVCPNEKELVTPIHENHYIAKMWDVDKPLKNKFREYGGVPAPGSGYRAGKELCLH